MKKRTTGAWVVHHMEKLRQVQNTGPYERIENAGRAGVLLAALAEGREAEVDNARVTALAQANGITARELPFLIKLLEQQRVLDSDGASVHVLGVTVDAVLEHTAEIFEDQQPSSDERATLFLAEEASRIPLSHSEAMERLGDEAKVTNPAELLTDVAEIGFVDSEEARRERLYFNGNLFRRDAVTKAAGMLSTLAPSERSAINTADALIAQSGCIPLVELERILGSDLFAKVGPLGVYDIHEVRNEQGSTFFVTKPAAFAKFTARDNEAPDAFVDDALDMAKALVACLTFGMIHRRPSEGKIVHITALLKRLIGGSEVGPATAIGRDYQALEQRGVVRIRPYGAGRFFMRLLKPDVGRLALNVLTSGDTSHEALPHFPGAAVTGYSPPEQTRERSRKRSNSVSRSHAHRILHTIRTGGGVR